LDEIINTVAGWCAYDDGIAASLRADLERRGIPEIEEGLWKSLQDHPCCRELLPWYNFRLAQFYSLRKDFTVARDTCIKAYRIVDDLEDLDDDDLRRAIMISAVTLESSG